MKILLLANKAPYPPNDGGALATYNMALGLSNAGAKITLLTIRTPKHPGPSGPFPKEFTDFVDLQTVFIDTTVSVGKALWNLLFSKRPYNAVRFDSPEFRLLIERKLLASRFDLVQLEGAYLHPYIKTIRKHFHGPIVLRAHNVEKEIWQRSAANQTNLLKKWYFNLLAKRIERLEADLLGKVDLLVPISSCDSEKLHHMGYAGLSYVSPAGYHLKNSLGSFDEFEHPSVFHLGGLDWHPNREGLIWFFDSCWTQVLKSVPQAKFYVAGRNAPKWFVKKIEKYKSVQYCGEVENAANFMRSKGIMIVPLLSGSGMRVKIIEGMVLGKAIVSTSIGAEGINAEPQRQIVIANSSQEFVASLVSLLQNIEYAKEMGQQAKEFAHKAFDNCLLTQNLMAFYVQFMQKEVLQHYEQH